MKKEIKELISVMESVRGEDAEISIFHKLYGEQKLRSIFNPIIDDRIGFSIKRQEIYIDKNKITTICLDNCILFADDIMEIRIKIKTE